MVVAAVCPWVGSGRQPAVKLGILEKRLSVDFDRRVDRSFP